jgi:hypothetical protein
MNRLRRRMAVAILAVTACRVHAQEAHVLVLRYRHADDVIPMLRPYLDPAGRMTGEGDRLHVQTTSQNLAQIRQLLAALDRPPRWLTITIRQDRPPVVAENKRVPNAAVVTDSRSASAPAADDGTRITRTQSSEQSVRVLEGERALIQFETAVPMTFRHFVVRGQALEELHGVVNYDALVQFVVRPRLAGTAVTLEIEPQDVSVLAEAGERDSLSSTARGRVGDWIPVGGADLREETTSSVPGDGTVRAQTRPITDQRGVWLKVDFADDGRR